MTAVLELLSYVVGLVQAIYGLVQGINSSVAREITPYAIQGDAATAALASQTAATQATAANTAIQDPTTGIVATHTAVVAQAADVTDVRNVVDGWHAPVLPASNLPDLFVVGPTYTGIGYELLTLVPSDDLAGNLAWWLRQSYKFAAYGAGVLGAPARQDAHFLCDLSLLMSDHTYEDMTSPNPAWWDILPGDTRLTWLNRTEPLFLWGVDGAGGKIHGWRTLGGLQSGPTWTFDMTEAQWRVAVGIGSFSPPVWPGLANVTVGTPVALASAVTVPGPLDGVIVDVTTPPTGGGQFALDSAIYYMKAGELTFISDNGDAEMWQYLTFEHSLYCPRQMVRADSCVLRGLGAIAGTVTPWITT